MENQAKSFGQGIPKEIVCRIPDLDLGQIVSSGQCFRMEEREPGLFSAIAGNRYLEIREIEKGKTGCFCFFSSPEEFQTFWRYYFDLERDYGRIKEKADKKDRYLNQAIQAGWGIRILRQELWETIVTFIISQQNNIPRIRRCVRLLCERYGEALVNFRGERYYGFPGPEQLAAAELEDLRACNLGYRAKYIKHTSQMILEGRLSIEELPTKSYEAARQELMKLEGVGIKVAECVCLFSLHHVDAFPVDTHVAQILAEHYPDGFPFKRYQGFAGIIQQYLFFYEVNRKPSCARQQTHHT